MFFQDEITINNFFNEFKRTFNSNWMTHGERCVFRKRLYKKYTSINENELFKDFFIIDKK